MHVPHEVERCLRYEKVHMRENLSEEIYKPEVKQVEDLCGLTMNNARPGEAVRILTKAFLTSFDHVQMTSMVGLTSLFIHNTAEINNLLVVIRNNVARIYREFPVSVAIKTKRKLHSGHAVFKKWVSGCEPSFCAPSFEDRRCNWSAVSLARCACQAPTSKKRWTTSELEGVSPAA